VKLPNVFILILPTTKNSDPVAINSWPTPIVPMRKEMKHAYTRYSIDYLEPGFALSAEQIFTLAALGWLGLPSDAK